MKRDVETMKQVIKKRSAIAIMVSIMTAVTFGAVSAPKQTGTDSDVSENNRCCSKEIA